jgi:fatty-acyl-CoA synthase
MSETLWGSLSAVARITPDHPVVVFEDRLQTYAELAARAERVSHVLWSLGVRPGDRVAFLAANRPEYLELLFGASRIGAALVPLNTRFGVVDLQESLRRCGAKVLFFASRFRKQDFVAMLAEVLGNFEHQPERRSDDFPELERLVSLDGERAFGLPAYEDLLRGCTGESIPELDRDALGGAGLLLFTSGSSGLPKPVVLHESQLVRTMRDIGQRQGIRSDDRVLSFLPYFHVFGGAITTLVPILKGGTIVMMEAFDTVQSLEAASRERCTVLYSVAPCYQAWLDHPDFHRYDVSAIRTGVCSAGKGVMSMVAKRVRQSLCPMHSLFGMTETTGVVTFTKRGDSEELATETAGCPLPGAEVRIVDPVTRHPLPPDSEGEICVRGDMVTRGYFRLREETEAAFDHDGWFRTGDRGWLSKDGYLRVSGRLDDRLRSGGENIDPREVEAFVERHPKVAHCYVVGVPDERLGEVPIAFVIPRPGETLDFQQELLAFCRSRIANFKIPRRFFFIEEAPGWMHKVQRHRLKQEAIQRLDREGRQLSSDRP